MKAIPIENNALSDKETLSALIDLMGNIDGGANTEDFQEVKEQMMNSGMTLDGLLNIIGDNIAEVATQRQIYPVSIQTLTETAQIPSYAHVTDACADIYADETIIIAPGETKLVSTGIALAIPEGFVCHIYARSGLSSKTSCRLANSVGIIDAGYRDEIKVPCWNAGIEPLEITQGMRIAQMDIMPSPAIEFSLVNDVKAIGTDRLGGFGSSGLFENTAADENG